MSDKPVIRAAKPDDYEAIAALIAESARRLGRDDYDPATIDAALQGPWGLDTQLIKDGTYFMVYVGGEFAACGGWSFRATLFGSDAEASRDPRKLDPATEPARIRAFFVHPDFARRGLGTLLLDYCEREATEAGFRSFALGATLPGQRLYLRHGYKPDPAVTYELTDGLSVDVIPMSRRPV